jgi:hypothetical protein
MAGKAKCAGHKEIPNEQNAYHQIGPPFFKTILTKTLKINIREATRSLPEQNTSGGRISSASPGRVFQAKNTKVRHAKHDIAVCVSLRLSNA